jgi:hypothetical protein
MTPQRKQIQPPELTGELPGAFRWFFRARDGIGRHRRTRSPGTVEQPRQVRLITWGFESLQAHQELHPDTNGETYRPDAETVLVSVPYALRCKPLMIIAGDRGRLRGLHSQPSKGICRGSGHNVCQLPRRKIKGGILGALRRAGSSWAYRGDESQL